MLPLIAEKTVTTAQSCATVGSKRVMGSRQVRRFLRALRLIEGTHRRRGPCILRVFLSTFADRQSASDAAPDCLLGSADSAALR